MDLNNRAIMKNLNKLLGILCFLLAPLSIGFGLFGLKVNGPSYWWSISATYFASSKIWMIGLLFTTAVLFFSYKGYDKIDRIITDISGLAAFLIIAFPCNCSAATSNDILFPFIDMKYSNIVHCVSAGLLFASFAIMIAWRFPKTSKETNNPIIIFKDAFSIQYGGRKRMRNRIYYICAAVIVIFSILQVITSLLHIPQMTVINEFFMLSAFSVAWITKGEGFKFLNDKKE